jgi:membrane protein DedA with SNARE-associated domain
MPRNAFLLWNALAAIVSSHVAVLGAYAIASALLGQLSGRCTVVALVVAVAAAASAGLAVYRRRARSHATERRAG